MKALAWLALPFAALMACGGAAVPVPTAADASRGSAHFPGLTLNELNHGRQLYLSRCGSCHALKRPAELSAERWQTEVLEMREKNGVKLSEDETQAIIRYLSVAASPG
jgi:cytochrome c5